MKYLRDMQLSGKTVLLRLDINSDVKNKKLIPGKRIKQAAYTIDLLKKHHAKIVILAHQGNPKKPDFISLKQHAHILNKYTKVQFVNKVVSKKAVKAIQSLKNGQALLLENVRFEVDEFRPNKKNNILLKTLAPFCNLYVNDAFSVLHRDHTSIVGFPKTLPSFIGPLIEQELHAISQAKVKHALYILGGGKPESCVKLLGKNKVLPTGIFAPLVVQALGKGLIKNKTIKDAALIKKGYKNLLEHIRKHKRNIVLPIDFATLVNGKRKEYDIEDFPNHLPVVDIGAKTIKRYRQEITRAKSIYIRGPAGLSHNKQTLKGTKELLKAISKSHAYSLLGGGHLNDMIKASKISEKKFNYISLSGGALLSYIAGEQLPGLVALGYY